MSHGQGSSNNAERAQFNGVTTSAADAEGNR
jgi:hypothetical protein